MDIDYKAKIHEGLTWDEWLAGTSGAAADKMRSIYEKLELTDDDVTFLKSIRTKIHILCLSESWCGDCVQQVPIMARLCAENPKINFRIIGRDDNLDVMDRYLFNSAAVIPVFVFFNENFVEVGCWKARPALCREMIARGKAAGRLAEAKSEAAQMMKEAKGRLSVEEFKHLLDMACEVPR